MKRLTQIFCIATVSTLLGCASNPSKDTLTEYHEVVFRIENGTRVKEKESRFVQEYDEQGEVSKILYYDDDVDTLSRYTERHRDPHSDIVTHTSFDASGTKEGWSKALLRDEKVIWHKSYDSEGNLTLRIESKFDMQGRQTEATYLKGDGSVLHSLVKDYDDDANTMTQTIYDAEGNRKPGKIVNRYDDKNNLIRQDWYDSPDSIHLTFEYTYLAGKRQTEIQSSFGKVFKKKISKHDMTGNKKETHTYESVEDSEELILHEIKISDYKY